jgi:threonine dehydrogenase-like Zn-dependent dehydrogenase
VVRCCMPPGDVRVEERQDPKLVEPTDAILRLSAACVCGSDLWPYRGIEPVQGPSPMGHEYVGVVQEVGRQVRTIRPGQFVVGSFWASDNTCELCQAGYQSACVQRAPLGALGAQAELLRVPLADGTLVATPEPPPDDLVPSLLAASDVLGTGWFAAVAAEAGPGGLGAHSVVEGVGTRESMLQAIGSTRPGGHVGFVGVAHGVEPGEAGPPTTASRHSAQDRTTPAHSHEAVTLSNENPCSRFRVCPARSGRPAARSGPLTGPAIGGKLSRTWSARSVVPQQRRATIRDDAARGGSCP